MIVISDNEFTKSFDRYLESVQYEPIAVTSNDKVIGYFISPVEFENYLQVKAQLPLTLYVDELLEDALKAIALSKMDARHDHLNSLLDG